MAYPPSESFIPIPFFQDGTVFLCRRKTPRTIVEKIAKHVILAARDPDNVAQLKKLGMEPGGETPDEFAAQIAREQPQFDEAIRAAKLKP